MEHQVWVNQLNSQNSINLSSINIIKKGAAGIDFKFDRCVNDGSGIFLAF